MVARRTVNALAGGLVALLLALGAAPGLASARPRATAARSVTVSETGRLHRTSGNLAHLNEQGSASGTIKGAVYIHLRVGARQTFTAEVNFYPRGGSISGRGSGRYSLSGGSARFSGTVAIARGTGTYAHARAENLRFSGSIRRSDEAVTVTLSGTLRY